MLVDCKRHKVSLYTDRVSVPTAENEALRKHKLLLPGLYKQSIYLFLVKAAHFGNLCEELEDFCLFDDVVCCVLNLEYFDQVDEVCLFEIVA